MMVLFFFDLVIFPREYSCLGSRKAQWENKSTEKLIFILFSVSINTLKLWARYLISSSYRHTNYLGNVYLKIGNIRLIRLKLHISSSARLMTSRKDLQGHSTTNGHPEFFNHCYLRFQTAFTKLGLPKQK